MPWVAWLYMPWLPAGQRWRWLPETSRRCESMEQIGFYCADHGIDPDSIETVVLRKGRRPDGPTDIVPGEIPQGDFPVSW